MGTQMAVLEITLAALKEEGIYKTEDLFKFSNDDLYSIFESLRKPLVKVVNKKVFGVAPHVMSEKSRKCIMVATEATRYYAQFGRDITPTNMHSKTLTNFDIQWNALKDIKEQENPDVPKLTKNGNIINFIESFKLHLNAIIGVRNFLLVCAVRYQRDLSGLTLYTLIPDHTHSKEHGLVEVEMISLTSHDHSLLINYNGEVYAKMERALIGSQYAPTIFRFRKKQ